MPGEIAGSILVRPVEAEPSPAQRVLTALHAVPADHPSRPALRAQAIVAWLPAARRLAGRYRSRGVPYEDLVQIATVGLIKAVDRYEPAHGADFMAFAVPTIAGEIKRYFRDRTWAIRIPRKLQERRAAITVANAELTHLLYRAPTVADIAMHLRLTEEEVLDGLEGARAYRATSLFTRVGVDGHSELADSLGEEDHEFALTEIRVALKPALASLGERERRILTLRFYGNLTQSEIAAQVGLSQMHVSRLLTQSLLKLRRQLAPDGP